LREHDVIASVRHAVICLVACSSAASAPTPPEPVSKSVTVKTASPAVVTIGVRTNDAVVTRARIVATVDDGKPSDKPSYARSGQRVTLYAVIATKGAVYTDAALPKAHPLAEAPLVTLAWNRVEPASNNYSNGEPDTFHYEPIDYQATPIDAHTGSIAPDIRPTLTPDHGNGVGTMRYQLVVAQGDRTIASPGVDARRGNGSGGLTDAVTRVSIRRDDTYLGYLTEMYGQPYIWASSGLTDATHQSDRLEGSDCADFVVYGRRRMGKHVAYTWTGGLPDVTKLLASGARGDDGIYRDKKGKPIAFPEVGDLVLFPRHVGVLVEDRGTIGVLDDQDILMHTLFDSPKEVPLADSGYADKPIELRRW